MKLLLAPIQGMTIAYYRNLYSEIFGGIDEYHAPFIATTYLRKESPTLFKDLLPEHNSRNMRVVPQLLGNNGSDFRYFASTIVDMGYDALNWNIGCPFPMVTKKKKGSGLLIYPDMIRAFLEEVCKDSSYDLTVKMRLGLNHLDEGMKVMEVLNDYPLKGVTIHARTGIQKYAGTVDLDAFETLNAACNHEVTYNGDIYTFKDFKKISDRHPSIDNFMIGRGALRDPFLPSAIKGQVISNDKKIEKIKLFHDSVYQHYENVLSGEKHLGDKMKEFWMYLSTNIDPSGKFMKKINKSTSSMAYLNVVNQMFESSVTWKDS